MAELTEAKLEELRNRDDPRVQRAKAAGLKAEGIDIREDASDINHAYEHHLETGYVPSDGSDLGAAKEIWIEVGPDAVAHWEEITPEERARRVAEAEAAEPEPEEEEEESTGISEPQPGAPQ